MKIKNFIAKTTVRLGVIYFFIIIFILFGSIIAGSEITPQTRILDREGMKNMVNILLYFLQPTCSVLLFWNNLLAGKLNESQESVYNSYILFFLMICSVLNAIFFLSGKFSDDGLFKTIFNVIYWAVNIMFIGFTAIKRGIDFYRHR